MTMIGNSFRMQGPFSGIMDEDYPGSPYQLFEPDDVADPQPSPYKVALEKQLAREGTGSSDRRGFSGNVSPYEPGYEPERAAQAVPDKIASAGNAPEPDPAGVRGEKPPASSPERPNDYGDAAAAPDRPRSPAWDAVSRIDAEIAEEKRSAGSLVSGIAGLFSNSSSRYQQSMKMRDLLAERNELTRQAEYEDNRRSTEPMGKTFDVVRSDGTHRVQMTRGGQQIDLGLRPESDREKAARIHADSAERIAKAKAAAMVPGKEQLNENGEATFFNPVTQRQEVIKATQEYTAQGPMPDTGFAGVPETADVPFRPKQPAKETTPQAVGQPIVDNDGNVSVIMKDPTTGKMALTRLGGGGKKTQPKAGFDEKVTPAIVAETERAYQKWESGLGSTATPEEQDEMRTKIRDRIVGDFNFHVTQAGKPAPFAPKPQPEGPAAPPPTANYTKEDFAAGKPPKNGDVAMMRDKKTGAMAPMRFDATKGTWVSVK
jgi:hypothetical protein